MAARHWVGGTANWDATAGTKWALTNGGGGGQAVPTSSDDVFLDSGSGANTVTISGSRVCKTLTTTGFTGTLAGTSTPALAVSGDIVLNSGMTWSLTGTVTINATANFTSNTLALSSPVTVSGSGITVTLQDNLTLGVTNTFTLTQGTLALNGKTLSAGLFVSTVSNTRAITAGGGKIVASGTGTVWSTATTGYTLNDALRVELTDSSATARTVTTGAMTEANNPSIYITAGSGTITWSTSRAKTLDFTGFTGTWSLSNPVLFGDLVLNSSMATSSTGGISFSATSGTQSLTFGNSSSFTSSLTFNGVGGTFKLLDNWTTTGNIFLTNGALDLNGKTLTGPIFSSSNSNTRSITAGGGKIVLTGTGTVWSTSTITGFALVDALRVDLTDASATARTVTTGNLTEANCPSFYITAGTGALANISRATTLDFTGYSGTWTVSVPIIYSDLVLNSSMTLSGVTTIHISGTTSTQTITSGGASLTQNVQLDGTQVVKLGDAFTTTGNFTLTSGTIDLNSKTLTVLTFTNTGSSTRSIKDTVGSGRIKTTQTSVTTAFNTTGSGFTTDLTNTWAVEISGNTTNARMFAGNGLTYGALTFSNTTANGQLSISDSNTFKSISVSNPPQSVKFTAATTTTIQDDNGFPSGTGTSNRVTIDSLTAAQHALVKSGGGRILSRYLSVTHSDATPVDDTWYAGHVANSTNGGNNSGWHFDDYGISPQTAGAYTLSGQAETPELAMPADRGVYALTGQTALAATIAPDAGSFALTGKAASLVPPYRAGAYVLTGKDVLFAVVLSADPGSYALTGKDVVLSLLMPADAGAYALAGELALLSQSVGAGAYALGGQAAAFVTVMPLGAAAYTLTGVQAALSYFTIAPATFVLVGHRAGLHAPQADHQFMFVVPRRGSVWAPDPRRPGALIPGGVKLAAVDARPASGRAPGRVVESSL